ncbi:hypothetical protein WOLCODRAFT_161168 [Wolfiporia cocos MD-104 SS10]|uniref:CENP-C homolog n=1 Tax=Wolfiporia cocos (strain MD-104) TaxID=742152 RepID=A0A2H3JDP3_WOLCO|nr:hypothetical protein WOLCODRAFT_161168 [Wolfiporia cocos MD-104 SS10]
MPASARKSSISSRRVTGVNKYVPYRADDYEHGKKTGIAVRYVDHKSDDFEPFDKVIGQADARTPPRVPAARKRRTPKPKTPVRPAQQDDDEDDDEFGEMDMSLDDNVPNSPAAYFRQTRVSAITDSVQRVGSSTRPVSQSSDVDFDAVPSPRPVPRKSVGYPRPSTSSRLSKSTLRDDDESEQEQDDGGDGGDDGFGQAGFDSDDDDVPVAPYDSSPKSQSRGQQARASGTTPRRKSFAQIEEEDEEEEDDERHEHQEPDEELDSRPSGSFSSKGKRRYEDDVHELEPVQDQDHDMDVEDDIAQGMADVEMQQFSEDEEEQEQAQKSRKRGGKARGEDDSIENHQPAGKKARTEQQDDEEEEGEHDEPRKRKGRTRKNEAVLRDITPGDANHPDGLRRGTRSRYAPLEWWRCEKVVYGRRESGVSFVPTIKEIRRIPKEEPQPLGGRHRRPRARSKSKTVGPAARMASEGLVFDPEEGWDDETEPEGIVLDYERGKEIERRLAFTAKMINPKPALNSDFYFHKVFADEDFVAAGEMVIPPNKQKPTKNTKDNTFVFYVIEGAVNCKVHRTNFLLATGGMFLVPRGNLYYIQNASDRDARLFFAQARKSTEHGDEEHEYGIGSEEAFEGRRSASRKLSAGPAS